MITIMAIAVIAYYLLAYVESLIFTQWNKPGVHKHLL